VWFIVDRIEFGGGIDIDARNTTAEDSRTSKASCLRVPGSSARVLADAPEGIDNNFTRDVVATSRSGGADLQVAFDNNLASGGPTLLIELEHGIADDAIIAARVHVVSAAGIFDQPPLEIPNGRMHNGNYEGVTTLGRRLTMPFSYVGLTGALVIEQLLLRFDLRTGIATVAAVLPASSLFVRHPFIGRWCLESASGLAEQLMNVMETSADLTLASPSMPDATRACDGISLGARVTLHAIDPVAAHLPAPVIPQLPCP
jgi:hypothetical protein